MTDLETSLERFLAGQDNEDEVLGLLCDAQLLAAAVPDRGEVQVFVDDPEDGEFVAVFTSARYVSCHIAEVTTTSLSDLRPFLAGRTLEVNRDTPLSVSAHGDDLLARLAAAVPEAADDAS